MYVANQSIGFYMMGILGLSKFSKSQARFYYYFFEKKKKKDSGTGVFLGILRNF